MLEGSGYSVLLAKDGREAIDVFQQKASEIAIVLLDMTVPVMGGKEAFRLIRKRSTVRCHGSNSISARQIERTSTRHGHGAEAKE
jgi:CheY-like chemotaxis protein